MTPACAKRIDLAAVCFCMALLSASCKVQDQNPVSIVKNAPEIKWMRLDESTSLEVGMDPTDHYAAQTRWRFSIVPEFGFEIVENKKASGSFLTKVKITYVRMVLSLPITVQISKKADKIVESHEKGHIEICKRYYQKAEEFARKSAAGVIGQTYEGSGSTEKLALSQALVSAGADLGTRYSELMWTVNKVSQQYDQIMFRDSNRKAIDEAVGEAILDVENSRKQSTDESAGKKQRAK